MATIPTPATINAGDKVGFAAKVNTYRDCINFLFNPPKCLAYQTATTNFATSGTYAAVNLDTEMYDTDTMHDTSSTPNRVVINTAGKYTITAQVSFAANATGQRFITVRKNSGGSPTGGTQLQLANGNPVGSNTTTIATTPIELPFLVGDYIEIFAMQTSGAALASVAGQSATFLQIKLTGS